MEDRERHMDTWTHGTWMDTWTWDLDTEQM